jgi:hypothetical protein
MNLGIVYVLSHDYVAAEPEFRRVLEMQPGFLRGHSFLGATLMMQGRDDEACQVLESLVERGNRAPIYLWPLGIAYAMAGRLDKAHEVLDPINRSNFPPLYRAIAHKVLGEEDMIFSTLEQGIVERSDWMYSLGTQPWLVDLHGDPRFQAVLAKLRLPGAER